MQAEGLLLLQDICGWIGRPWIVPAASAPSMTKLTWLYVREAFHRLNAWMDKLATCSSSRITLIKPGNKASGA